MGSDKRNFRSNYYEKVGCRSIEEKKSLEILLKEKPWDKVKLKQFSLRFMIPTSYRYLVWKVQLGVLPTYTDLHSFVSTQRQAQFNDLQHALKVMRIVDNNTPKPQLFLAMFMLESGRLHYNFNLQMDCGMVPISRTLLQMYDDDVDVYWLAKGFYNFVEQFEKDIPKLIDSTKSLLEKEDQDLYRFLQDKNVLDCLPLNKWYTSCFAGILDESALVKIWDKVCGGSSKVLVYVAIVLLVTLRRGILRCEDAEQVLRCIHDVPEEAEEVIANKSIELWQQCGSMIPGQGESIINKAKPEIHLR
ncbi:TBC1 domain family member 7 [Arctopsyche grandis]|uniref:TBC1 domain family member 7 n=1 Tax=Arctopsyche grandis TaxID=121162 RepID=UPI00406D80DE